MTDNRTLNLILRPVSKPTKAELKQGEPPNKAVFMLLDWNGEEHWFQAELARVWVNELDG